MKRRKFFQSSLLSAAMLGLSPELTFATDRPTRGKSGINVKDGDNRLHENIKLDGITQIDFKVLGNDTDDGLMAFVSSNNVKGKGPALHIHPNFDEFFYVLESEFKFKVGDELFHLKMGDTMLVPKDIPHAFTCTSDRPGKLLTVVQPSGQLEAFLRAFSKVDKMTPEIAKKLSSDHNIIVVGPPLTAD